MHSHPQIYLVRHLDPDDYQRGYPVLQETALFLRTIQTLGALDRPRSPIAVVASPQERAVRTAKDLSSLLGTDFNTDNNVDMIAGNVVEDWIYGNRRSSPEIRAYAEFLFGLTSPTVVVTHLPNINLFIRRFPNHGEHTYLSPRLLDRLRQEMSG